MIVEITHKKKKKEIGIDVKKMGLPLIKEL